MNKNHLSSGELWLRKLGLWISKHVQISAHLFQAYITLLFMPNARKKSPYKLQQIAHKMEVFDCFLAEDHQTNPDILHTLSTHKSYLVLHLVATNPKTSEWTLAHMMISAKNKNTQANQQLLDTLNKRAKGFNLTELRTNIPREIFDNLNYTVHPSTTQNMWSTTTIETLNGTIQWQTPKLKNHLDEKNQTSP